jgi:hypothetical protein
MGMNYSGVRHGNGQDGGRGRNENDATETEVNESQEAIKKSHKLERVEEENSENC